ncbi:cell division protein DivIVA [Paenibacillus sambharensis]|uniref:Cell division protein DivIVA n=1 Tax=Paenibacillus sambharensis TaxID=1803190 RepID=A0A2W1LHW7_9BACL|nr:DivIVA domain-containing protein [Paenibacillus sambharensis]PZD94642.1 cell division protein DivIVA [Paenibacillus sambharensis]
MNGDIKIKTPKEFGIKLNALEIHEKDFPTVFRGYDAAEVDNYLDQIIKDYEAFEALINLLQKQLYQARQNAVVRPPKAPEADLDEIMQRIRELEVYCWGRAKG